MHRYLATSGMLFCVIAVFNCSCYLFVSRSRIKYMLETIFAIRNNNLRKIPNFDPSHLEHLRKLLKVMVRDRGI